VGTVLVQDDHIIHSAHYPGINRSDPRENGDKQFLQDGLLTNDHLARLGPIGIWKFMVLNTLSWLLGK